MDDVYAGIPSFPIEAVMGLSQAKEPFEGAMVRDEQKLRQYHLEGDFEFRFMVGCKVSHTILCCKDDEQLFERMLKRIRQNRLFIVKPLPKELKPAR